MIYLKESFDLHPATPAQRDRFVAVSEAKLIAASSREGGRLVGAFFAHEEWFSQIIHLTAFEDWAAFGAWREASSFSSSSELGEARQALAALSAERRDALLEPLGPVPASALDAAIADCAEQPAGDYTFAILDVSEGKMDDFKKLLTLGAARLPIIAALTDVAGNPNRVIDLWKGDTGKPGYAPTSDAMDAFFEPLREVAPRERMMRLHPMPYSPLR